MVTVKISKNLGPKTAAQCVKCLCYKLVGLSVSSRTHVKELDVMGSACKPIREGGRSGVGWSGGWGAVLEAVSQIV